MQTRFVSFAGSTVAVTYTGRRAAHIVDFLYRHIPNQDHLPPHLTYSLRPDDNSEQLLLEREETLLYAGESDGTLAERLLGDTCYSLAAESKGGLLLHAAGLVRQGQGLILPGSMGTGKSTLSAWLLARGFDYLTDELVFVANGADTIQAFTRPLNLKRSSRPIWQALYQGVEPENHLLSGSHSDLVSPHLFNPDNRLSEPAPHLIIFPHYQPEGDFSLRLLSKARAGLALMQCLINARNLANYGFPEAVRLVKRVPAYELSYSSFEQLGASIETLLESRIDKAG